jgi:outer membrane protein assembly factor BamB
VTRYRGWRVGWAVLLLAAIGCRRADEELPSGLAAFRPAPKDPIGWPQWRGPGASGVASSGSPAARFHASGGYRWKIEVPGEGNCSPIVWGDCVLLTTALAETDPPTLAVLCFDRRDGRLVWQKEAGQAQGRTHNKNGYASATLATDGERIVAFFGSTGLFCYDLSGKPLWHADLGDLDHQWGTASSPVIYKDLVIQVCDAGHDSSIAAFDKRTGKRAWRTQRPSSGCWTTPVPVEADEGGKKRTELIVNGTDGADADGRLVLAYDPSSGRELWRVRGTTQLVTPTTIVGSGLVYSTSGRNGPIMAIRPGGSGDVTDSHVVWKLSRGGPYIPTGIMYRDRLFILFDNGQLTCYRPDDGEVIWTKRVRGDFSASLVAADGRIYASSEQGVVYVFAAADEFELLAENNLIERIQATPAIAGGELFIRTAGHLYCIPGTR